MKENELKDYQREKAAEQKATQGPARSQVQVKWWWRKILQVVK